MCWFVFLIPHSLLSYLRHKILCLPTYFPFYFYSNGHLFLFLFGQGLWQGLDFVPSVHCFCFQAGQGQGLDGKTLVCCWGMRC